MPILYGKMSSNGEILNIIDFSDNNYFISVNAGDQRTKINDYHHIKTSKKSVEVISENLGNEVIKGNNENVVIIRNPKNGYYLYNVVEGKRITDYFDSMNFETVDEEEIVYASDTVCNHLRSIFSNLTLFFDLSGKIITPVYDNFSNQFYDSIDSSETYVELKNKVIEKLEETTYNKQNVINILIKRKK